VAGARRAGGPGGGRGRHSHDGYRHDYQHGHRHLRRAVRASFRSRAGYALPFFTFALRSRTGQVLAHPSSPLEQANEATSDDTGWIRLMGRRYADLPAGDTMTATMQATVTTRAEGGIGKLYPVLVSGVVLSPVSVLR
jgi:hypothetical protein